MNPEIITKTLTASGLMCGAAAYTCIRYKKPKAAKLLLGAGITILTIDAAAAVCISVTNSNSKNSDN